MTQNLDINRVAELEQVLQSLSKKIIDYVRKADSPEGTVGKLADPAVLASELKVAVSEKGQGIDGLIESSDMLLEHSVVTWHKAFLEKLYAGTNPVGIASDLLLSILNTNSHVFTASPALTVIEKYIGNKYAQMFGFVGPRSGGLTFPGGSYSNITSMHMARSIKVPETKTKGNTPGLCVFASEHAHYSVEKAAILLGLGSEAVIKVAVTDSGEMDVEDLERKVQKAESAGLKPFYVNTTAGSTVYGSFDDLVAIAEICKRHNLWFHVDGSWGGNVVFSEAQRPKLRGSEHADSLTANPHKMLGVPCTCSFLLVPDVNVFQTANSLRAPYLFHSDGDGENWDLADGTMGCGRRSDALKLYLGWQWYGTAGYGARVDHAFEMTAYLANKVNETPGFVLLSKLPPPCLQTCFFYAPRPSTAEETTRVTQAIVQELFRESRFLVDYSLHPEHGAFFRVVLNAPVVDKPLLDDLVASIAAIGNRITAK